MKTLIIQLARFGDIYLTWPVLTKLASQEGREVHLLVRETFSAATLGLPKNIVVHKLPSAQIMASVLNEESGVNEWAKTYEDWLDPVLSENFDQVYNFSFSTFSSHLTRSFEESGSQVFGYTRHADGFFNFRDDTSAYFHAQVGVGQPNQFHVSDLFAMMAEVDLEEHDRRASHVPEAHEDVTKYIQSLSDIGYVVFHVGASDMGKALSANQIKGMLIEIINRTPYSIVLIGSSKETELAQQTKPKVGSWRIVDLTGKTKLTDLFSLIKNSKTFIGVDSAPLHIASLVNAPTLNFSCSYVNPFETGPTSNQAQVMRCQFFSELDPVLVGSAVSALSQGQSVTKIETNRDESLSWSLVRSLYLGEPYPKLIYRNTALILSRLIEILPKINSAYEKPHEKSAQKTIGDFDGLLELYKTTDPFIKIFISWFNSERLRIPPGDFATVQGQTLQCLHNFQLVLMDWARQLGEDVQFLDERLDWSQQLDVVVKNFRFFNLEKGLQGLQDFLAENSHRLSAGVIDKGAGSIQKEIETAIQRADYSRVADLLEHDLRSLMSGKDMIA